MKIKVGDNVKIIAGKDKGAEGEVLRILKDKTASGKDKVVVKGVNIRTRHIRRSAQQAGQKIQFEAPISASNVAVVCPKTNKPTRIGYVVEKGKKKVRIAKVSQEKLDTKTVKKK